MPPETPILTKKQQKASLSAKKGKTKVTIRNILATPYKKYWPAVSPEHATTLHNAISTHLPKIVPDKAKIPWQELKKIPREERKRKQPTNISKEIRHGLAFGINDTCKAIEKGIVRSILIANDVKPKLMVEHLLDLSVLLRIPTLVVPELRDVLKRTCGITGVALALTDAEKFKEFQLIVKNLHKEYPVSKKHINYERSLDLAKEIVIEDQSDQSVTVIEDDTNNMQISSSEELEIGDEDGDHIQGSLSNQSVIVIEDEDSPSNIQSKIFIEADNKKSAESVYLYRDSKKTRVFVPNKSKDAISNIAKSDTDGFLALAADSSPGKKLYKSLKVRRIKGNNNRNKRKIGEMKDKKKRKKKRKGNKNKST